ncbi:MAG: hypothetical protein JNK75_05355 [Betaproteobacteria bacterium]|nr:hypothetical protein [Betaproteobacteria bacterium]
MNKAQLKALEAYMSLVSKKSASTSDYALKEHFAQEIVAHLPAGDLTPALYRQAVNDTLTDMPVEYKAQAVQVAREFYPFLNVDLKPVAAVKQTGGYRGFPEASGVATQQRIRTMPDLIAVADQYAHSPAFLDAHKKYLAVLRAKGLDEAAAAMRSRIAKALLYLCRDKTISSDLFRSAIDKVMPALTDEPARLFFVLVAREFYQFAAGKPNAPEGVKVTARYSGKEMFG